MRHKLALWAFVGAVFGLGLLGSCKARAASPDYCTLYARELLRIGIASGHDVDISTATESALKLIWLKTYSSCLNKDENPALPEPSPEAGNRAWLNMMMKYRELDGAAVPIDKIVDPKVAHAAAVTFNTVKDLPPIAPVAKEAKPIPPAAIESPMVCSRRSPSGFARGTPEQKKWCSHNYRSFRVSDGTVLCRTKQRSPCA